MKKRYIFFRGLIATLDLYTDEFVRIYTGQGAECLVLDAGRMEDEMVRLKAFLLEGAAAVISMNNIGMHLEFEQEQNIWDQFQIPFYNIMMDHPFHYKKALDNAPEQMVLLCMDRNHIEYARRFFPNIRRIVFFPHAGIRLSDLVLNVENADGSIHEPEYIDQPADREIRSGIPIAERKIDVLYAGGLARYAAEGLVPDLGKIKEFDAFELVHHALERLIQEPDLTTEHVIEQCLKDINFKYNNSVLGDIITELRFVDSFAVSFYREQVVRMLAECGVTVTIFGAGWDRCEWGHQNIVYGGELPPVQILELMNQSKIVLNTMTWFKRGAHDRIFNGMLAGAAVVSDTSEYMHEHFTNGRQLQLFSLKNLREMAERVKYLLEHTDEAQCMADCGYQAAARQHMWKNRLEDLFCAEGERQ